MSLSDIEIVFRSIKPFSDYVYLHVKGEPLIHPEISNILDLAHSFQLQVNITTTGISINTVRHKIFGKPALRQVNFSLHSYDERLPIFKSSNYLEDIFEFADQMSRDTKTYISFRLWNLDTDNALNAEQAKNRNLLEKIEAHYGLPQITEHVTPGSGIKLSERIFLHFEPRFAWPNLYSKHENAAGFCYGLRTHVGVLVDGTVIPCCLDGEGVIELGNIFRQNFGDILNSQRAKDIYNGFSENKAVEALCKKCSFKGKFQ